MPKRFRSNFTFGGTIAESDPFLVDAYYDNGDFDAIRSRDDPRCFIIGRTGSGKSAALRYLEETQPDRIVRIAPESLSLPYLINLNVTNYLVSLGVHLDPFFIALWKHVIVVELLKHRYPMHTANEQHTILNNLKNRLRRDPSKVKAIDYLNDFGDKFWCETDERVKQITEKLVDKVEASGGVDAKVGVLSAKTSGGIEHSHEQETKEELAARFQRIVNDTQMPRLNEMITLLGDEILESGQHLPI